MLRPARRRRVAARAGFPLRGVPHHDQPQGQALARVALDRDRAGARHARRAALGEQRRARPRRAHPCRGSPSHRAAAHGARGARPALRPRARRDRPGHRPHAPRGGAGRADGRHLLRLRSGAQRTVRRAAGEKRRRAGAGSRSLRSAQAVRMRKLYTALLRLALPLILLRLWWRGRREPGYREGVPERLGHYGLDAPPKLLWVHAVSVGEARAAAPLVRALAQALPDHRVLVTCTTAAGRETVKQVYGETVLAAYLPFDFPEPVQSFLEHFRPRLGVLMETEIWPNLLAGCAQNGVPVLLANARMSEKSARGYALWSALTRPAFAALAAVCAQSAADAERLRALGARDVEVTGNLKFDVHPDAAQVAAGRAWRAGRGRPEHVQLRGRDAPCRGGRRSRPGFRCRLGDPHCARADCGPVSTPADGRGRKEALRSPSRRDRETLKTWSVPD